MGVAVPVSDSVRMLVERNKILIFIEINFLAVDVTEIGTPDSPGFVLNAESKPRLKEKEILAPVSHDHEQTDVRKVTK